MQHYIKMLLLGSSILLSCALPVTKTKKEETTTSQYDIATNLEYERYLKEVVQTLETDPEFRKKLDKAPEADIRNGKIAQELEYVNHHVRTKLDEIKRRELDRLRELANKMFELENGIVREDLRNNHHLDHKNEHTFEIEDLKLLIKKTAEDLAAADLQRRADFKEYEMQKKFENEMIKKELDDEARKRFEEEQKELEQKHKKHEKVHHPANKAQMKEVWEKEDHMDKDDFDPGKFFMLHDVDSNGYWDEDEVKALFVKELDKVYKPGMSKEDMRERAEEMERMREVVFKEKDTNRDDLISFEEFKEGIKRDEYNKDPEWHTIDEQPQYTQEEYLEFERRRKEEVDRKIAQGLIPPHPNMPQGYYVHNPNTAYRTAQQHPSGNQQQPQMHYQDSQQQHLQQQQQYQQQQHQYQQQQYQNQQQQYNGQQVHLNSNQVYHQIPVQQQINQPQQQNYPQQPQQPQQQHQQIGNNINPQQAGASNSGTPQSNVNNILPNQQPVAANNIPQQQHSINNGMQQQPINVIKI